MSPKDRMLKARAWLIVNQPFFATLALYLKLVEDDSCESMETDGVELRYSPAYVKQLTDPELRGTFAHEVLHPACQHHTRRNNRDPELWNEACDYVVNPIVLQAGFKLAEGFLYEPAYKGMGAEEVYSRLKSKAQQNNTNQNVQSQSNNTSPSVNTNVNTDNKGLTPSPPVAGAGQGGTQGTSQAPFTSAAPAHARLGKALGQGGRVVDAPGGTSPAVTLAHTTEWHRRVRQASAIASGAGLLPDALKELVAKYNTPKMDWRDQLRRFIDDKIVVEHSWVHPNKRMLGLGFILPGSRADGISKLGIVMDTSGSINNKLLSKFCSEIESAMDAGSVAEAIIIQCDAKVQHVERFQMGDPIKMEAHGRGGTLFSPALAWFAANEPDVAALIYLTDLDTSDWGIEPACPIMWGSYGLASTIEQRKKRVPFGEVLYIDDEN